MKKKIEGGKSHNLSPLHTVLRFGSVFFPHTDPKNIRKKSPNPSGLKKNAYHPVGSGSETLLKTHWRQVGSFYGKKIHGKSDEKKNIYSFKHVVCQTGASTGLLPWEGWPPPKFLAPDPVTTNCTRFLLR